MIGYHGILTVAVSALTFTIPTNAWGTLGHRTVASVAIQYLKPTTLSAVNAILANDPTKTTSNPTLIDVATWADSYRYTTAGSFTAPFHYVDANDNPPSSCGVDYARDCVGGCVISAMWVFLNQLNVFKTAG
ncbi:hypothetical protein FRB99_004770 [Tulasnella sp. 403]|nr:hypothetical protein FRB99_004770 [Tulasnella sp. 403]